MLTLAATSMPLGGAKGNDLLTADTPEDIKVQLRTQSRRTNNTLTFSRKAKSSEY